MNETPPSRAKAIAIVSLETDCMMADTIGTFKDSAGVSPFLNFTSGVCNETFAGTHSADE
jgi:hypothetical protein